MSQESEVLRGVVSTSQTSFGVRCINLLEKTRASKIREKLVEDRKLILVL